MCDIKCVMHPSIIYTHCPCPIHGLDHSLPLLHFPLTTALIILKHMFHCLTFYLSIGYVSMCSVCPTDCKQHIILIKEMCTVASYALPL